MGGTINNDLHDFERFMERCEEVARLCMRRGSAARLRCRSRLSCVEKNMGLDLSIRARHSASSTAGSADVG